MPAASNVPASSKTGAPPGPGREMPHELPVSKSLPAVGLS